MAWKTNEVAAAVKGIATISFKVVECCREGNVEGRNDGTSDIEGDIMRGCLTIYWASGESGGFRTTSFSSRSWDIDVQVEQRSIVLSRKGPDSKDIDCPRPSSDRYEIVFI